MSVRQVKTRRHRGYDDSHKFFLRCGLTFPFIGSAWGRDWETSDEETKQAILEDMENCWRLHGEEIEAEHQAWHKEPASRSWGWWRFASPEPLRQDVPEWHQLHLMGLVTAEQARAAADRQMKFHDNGHYAATFRRHFAWWLYHAPERRNPAKLELSQLVELHRKHGEILRPMEQALLACDEKVLTARYGKSRRDWACHLEPAERELLGLPPVLHLAPRTVESETDEP